MKTHLLPGPRAQAGAAAVEFALIALLAFLPLLLGIVEAGRMFYVVTTTQEVTRRAAREQVVRWLSQSGAVQRYAVFREPGAGAAPLPGGTEISSSDVRLTFYGSYADAISGDNPISGGTPQSNLSNCIKSLFWFLFEILDGLMTGAMAEGWFGTLLQVPLPEATVIMPAEALGLL